MSVTTVVTGIAEYIDASFGSTQRKGCFVKRAFAIVVFMGLMLLCLFLVLGRFMTNERNQLKAELVEMRTELFKTQAELVETHAENERLKSLLVSPLDGPEKLVDAEDESPPAQEGKRSFDNPLDTGIVISRGLKIGSDLQRQNDLEQKFRAFNEKVQKITEELITELQALEK